MPYTQNQLDAINLVLDGDPADPVPNGLESNLSKMVHTISKMRSFLVVHDSFADNTELMGAMRSMKDEAKASADAMALLLA